MPGRLFKINSVRIRRAVFYIQFLLWPTLLVYAGGILGVRLNLSPSVPIGLYLVSDDPRADLVEFCPPEPFGTLSVLRGYRGQSNACPDGGQPLLKPIVAREGDVVETSKTGIAVNGFLLPRSKPQLTDSVGRRMSSWHFGKFSVVAGQIWVVSWYNMHSFDSRYFGPVTVLSIKRRLRPLWTVRLRE